MEEEFWLESWVQNRTGFHQTKINPYLLKFWPDLGVEPEAGVFVPLCGKSLDMIWLAEQGHRVIGVEISPLAAAQFFAENDLSPFQEAVPGFTRLVSGRIAVLNGNFFDLSEAHLAGVAAAYDRAALVAMPPGMRPKYAAHFARLMAPGSVTFLITFHYPQDQMAGPPFSVSAQEVQALYEENFVIESLAVRDILAKAPRIADRGLTGFVQEMFALRRR